MAKKKAVDLILQTLTSGEKKFVDDILKYAAKYGISVKLIAEKVLHLTEEKNSTCAGYFDSEKKELAVATKLKKGEWLGTLSHEASHMEQWAENKYLWHKMEHGHTLFFEWLLDKKIVKREILEEAVQDVIRLEKDCELRAIKKIKKYNLNINLDEYCRKANSYLYGYLFFFEKRKWIPKIYSYDCVWKEAPARFPKEYKKIPRRLYAQFKKLY